MRRVEEGYVVSYDLAQVVAHAEQAVAADPAAAMEIAHDGSRLRFTAGPTARLVALGREGRTANHPLKLTFERRRPLAILPADASEGDATQLEFMRAHLGTGCRRLYLTKRVAADAGWLLTLNRALDLRLPPYNMPDRYMLIPINQGERWYVLDLETGLPYRTGEGRAARKGSHQEMCALIDQLTAS